MAEAGLHAAGFILAGGQSARMGTDKALVPFCGEPLIAHALRTLRQVCAEVAIAGGAPALAAYAPLVQDDTPYQGPLGGIVAALRHTTRDWNLFLPVDTPFLPAEALRRLLTTRCSAETVAILAQPADHINPLVALYHRRALPTLGAELAAGRLRVRSAIESAGPVAFAQFPHAFQQAWFRNLNTPADLLDASAPDGRERR